MDWTSVSSSNVDAVAWEDGDLYVRFHNGRTYKYKNVPSEEFVNMVEASSVGGYFAANIKTSFPCIQQ